MKLKKLFSRMTALLFAILLVAVLPLSASAQTLEVQPFEFPSVCGSSEVQPYSFVRDYTVNLTSNGYTTVMQDSNWWSENLVAIGFSDSSGPQSVSVYAIDGGGNKKGPYDLGYKESTAFYLKNTGPFTIFAKVLTGKNGSATFTVSLNNSYS